MESSSTLTHIAARIAEQLTWLDVDAGETFLADVTGILNPLQVQLAGARDGIRGLIARAEAATDTAELRVVNDLAINAASTIYFSLNSVAMVQEICTRVREAIAERALELARQELSAAGRTSDLPLALFAVGSDGRKEQTLITDQDYLFLYGSGDHDPFASVEAADDYFGKLGEIFSTKMDEAGISRCSGGIMPVNDEWRGTLPQWQERLTALFRFERADWEKNILTLIALIDSRFICGDRELGAIFGKTVRSQVRDTPQALRHMARVVSSMRLSRGFRRRFVVEAEGPHKGEFNIKIFAWMPLVMCLRLLAVHVGIEETSTPGRIGRLRKAGHITDKVADDLHHAYLVITRYRIVQQTKKLKRIIDDDCYLNPYELPSQEREELKDVISVIDDLQNTVRSRFAMTASVDRILLPRL